MKTILKLMLIGALSCNLASCSSNKVYNPNRGEGNYILTPKESPNVEIHGPSVFGVRPGSPFLFTIPATGEGKLTYAVENLPKGLSFDAHTGIIRGKIISKKHANYKVKFVVKNALGTASKNFVIKVGDEICLTPPLGWNSWNCWGHEVSQKNVLASATAMVNMGLKNYGWSFINIDDVWQGKRGGKYNAIQPNPVSFPDMRELCDSIHNMGLKAGIYSTPWITTYAGYVGSTSDYKSGYWKIPANKEEKNEGHHIGKYHFENNDAKQWAEWGFDYLKYDWNPNDLTNTKLMYDALRNSGRDIVYSLSNTCPMAIGKKISTMANVIRTAGDLKARWDQPGSNLNIREEWQIHKHWLQMSFKGSIGHYPDPDMLVVGNAKKAMNSKYRLTADEQYTHVSLWALWSAPLLIGCPIETMDDFTLNLLTNSEVLDIQQDELCKSAVSILCSPKYEIFEKELADGNKAIGLFNLQDNEAQITLDWNVANLEGPQMFRDVWRQKNIGTYENSFSAIVPPHGVILLKVTSK